MALIDEQGRLFGRLNLIDFAIGIFCVVLVPVAYGAYVLFRTPVPTISTIETAVVGPGKELRVTLTGTGFRPFLSAGVGSIRATGLLVESPTKAEVKFPGLQPGTYDFVLFDESREVARRPGAVTIVGPPPPPQFSIEVRISGSFTPAPEKVVAGLKSGMKLPEGSAQPEAEILSVGKASQEVVRVATATGMLERPVPGLVRVPAVLRVRCTAVGGACKVGSVTVGAGAIITLSGLATPFEIFDVSAPDRSPQFDLPPNHRVFEISVRLTTSPEAWPLLRQGAIDHDRRLFNPEISPAAGAVLLSFKKQRDIETTSSMDWAGADVKGDRQLLGIPRPLTMLTATLRVPVDRALDGWQYKASAVKLGAPFSFEGPLYTLRGWIEDVNVAPGRAANAARAGRR